MCTTASDIRNCVIGNIRQMDKVRKDMKQFKEFIESRNISQMEKLCKLAKFSELINESLEVMARVTINTSDFRLKITCM